jgi:pSer/pThr/pTyr-binding forkhead associated (FHA) protein
MYKLIIQDDEGKTTVVPLLRDEITIGRKEGNTIRLTERNVSRRHARIVKANGAVMVEDLDSYNGVKVNGTRIQGRLAVGEADRIQIGDYLLELKQERGAESHPGHLGQPGQGQGQSVPPPRTAWSWEGCTRRCRPCRWRRRWEVVRRRRATAPRRTCNVRRRPRCASTAPMAPYPAAPAPDLAAQHAIAGAETVDEDQPHHPGKLVVVSSNFAGREFILDRPQMVIGRTDENDIVVNHRSISRHHAKIVLEQGRYCIVDMQSSNGVRGERRGVRQGRAPSRRHGRSRPRAPALRRARRRFRLRARRDAHRGRRAQG